MITIAIAITIAIISMLPRKKKQKNKKQKSKQVCVLCVVCCCSFFLGCSGKSHYDHHTEQRAIPSLTPDPHTHTPATPRHATPRPRPATCLKGRTPRSHCGCATQPKHTLPFCMQQTAMATHPTTHTLTHHQLFAHGHSRRSRGCVCFKCVFGLCGCIYVCMHAFVLCGRIYVCMHALACMWWWAAATRCACMRW